VLPVVGFGMAATLSLVPLLLRSPRVASGPGAASSVALLAVVVTAVFTVSTVVILATMVADMVRFPLKGRHPLWAVVEIAKMWVLLPVAGLAFGVLPALDAQTKLALGLPLEWAVTAKSARPDDRSPHESTRASATDTDS
jgi:apolipoprotein N-acyltransferase